MAYTESMRNRKIWTMRSLRFVWLLAGLQTFPLEVLADVSQPDPGLIPYVSASYAYLPAADFEAAGTGSSIKAKETRLALGIAGFETGDFRLDAGLDYQYNHYAYQNVVSRSRDLHRLQFPIGFSRRGDGLNLTGFVAPGVATSSNVFKDFIDRSSSDDFVVTGRLEAVIPREPRFAWLGGIAYDRSFGEDKVYPVFGLHYEPEERMALRLAFPDSSIRYRLSERQRLSLRLFPAGFAWHVVSDTLNDDFDYELQAVRLQGVWSWRVVGEFTLDLSVAYEFDRQHRFVDDTGRIVDSSVDSQFLAVLGLRWGNGPFPYSNQVARPDRLPE